ncbi:SDR family NAD(P)-dependent oxidoreductase [Bosea sp. (in: a-proteobacteria)]|uniref:SDR family NAD(P)-dependent oxidoreductase n=1 Tax=Bosea sp. (in: a-proteobacteria) TaxID=1871050 RepID=UPI003F704514
MSVVVTASPERPSDRCKVAVISGGSSGIGFACAGVLLTRGYRVVLLARDRARLCEAKRALEDAMPNRVEILCVDVTDAAATQGAIAQIKRQFQRIDWLITSAGIVDPGLFRELDLSSHRLQMETNYFGSLHLIHAAVPVMRQNGGGRITLVSSGAAFIGIAGYSGYAPGKFAVRALAEILHLELASDKIAVSVAFPPDTDTPQLAGEKPKRPLVTQAIAAEGGVMAASDVARLIIAQAERGAFELTPSRLMGLLARFHVLCKPVLVWKQRQILKRRGDRA